MSGFREDILSILRHNMMLHRDSIGVILGDGLRSAIDDIHTKGYIISSLWDSHTKYDYIIISKDRVSSRTLLRALTNLKSGGIIVLEITGRDSKYENRYLYMVGGTMSATKIRYGDRSYIVIHTGGDYGN